MVVLELEVVFTVLTWVWLVLLTKSFELFAGGGVLNSSNGLLVRSKGPPVEDEDDSVVLNVSNGLMFRSNGPDDVELVTT